MVKVMEGAMVDQFNIDGIRTELRRFSPAVPNVFGGQADAE